jgi:hypothetical protein
VQIQSQVTKDDFAGDFQFAVMAEFSWARDHAAVVQSGKRSFGHGRDTWKHHQNQENQDDSHKIYQTIQRFERIVPACAKSR